MQLIGNTGANRGSQMEGYMSDLRGEIARKKF